MKLFYAEMFFGLDWEEITSYGKKISRKQIIVCTTKVLRKRQINKNTSDNTSKLYCLPVLSSNNLYQNDTILHGMT